MLKSRSRIAALVVVLALAVATVASATVFTSGNIYGGTFTGTQSGSQAWTFANTSGGTTLVSCTTASFTGKVQPTSPQSSVTFQPSYTGCLSGGRAYVFSTSAWKLSVSSYDDVTGISAKGFITTAGPVVISPSGLTCKITIANQTISNGLTAQDTSGGVNSTHTTADGMTLKANGANATYTSNCVGFSASGFASYTGIMKIAGAWAGP